MILMSICLADSEKLHLDGCLFLSDCHVRGVDSSAVDVDDDDDDDDVFSDPSRVRLILQTKDSKAKKCSLVIFKVSVRLLLLKLCMLCKEDEWDPRRPR